MNWKTALEPQAADAVQDVLDLSDKFALTGPRQLLEVHPGGGQDGINRVTGNPLQPVALQPVFVLQVSDAGFDGSSVLHPLPECLCRASSLPFIDVHLSHTVGVTFWPP